MFQKSRGTGSVFITMKQYDGRDKPRASGDKKEQAQYKCLVRATLGKKKITTIVNPKDMKGFNQSYFNVLKINLDGLKKKDEEKKKEKIPHKKVA